MELKRKQFDQYLWQCFIKFLEKEADNLKKESKPFIPHNEALNRNPKQVPEILWKLTVKRNIKKYNHN